ncbi:MAG: 4'-phosphopantetheinyl transferase superfamily protein [Pedosphaera sp.]|nr:4'-phosphopantetheinyl transferase superfamily protein [Pedosphaera sp.]
MDSKFDHEPIHSSDRGRAGCDSILWSVPLSHPLLADDEIHVWCATLDQAPSYRGKLAETLSEDERQRAARFHFEGDRRRFIVGRGLLRSILGCYLNIKAGELAFCYNPQGKPSLATPLQIHFNLAHSHNLALYAITRRREIGVDIERVRPVSGMKEIVQRFFCAAEATHILSLPEEQKAEGFFNCWTRKEAYLKATGEGIAEALNQFEVSLRPGEPAALLHDAMNPTEASRWALFDLKPARDYAAALAVKEQLLQVQFGQWTADISNQATDH